MRKELLLNSKGLFMSGIGVKLLAFGVGFMTGIGSSMLMNETKEPVPSAEVPAAVSVDQPVSSKGYDFFSQPQITVKWKPGPVYENVPCRDSTILPIWNAIRRDKELREDLDAGRSDCSDLFEFKNVDLNQDGKMEILVRGQAPPLCGGTGNCRFWVFEKNGSSYRMLLAASDDADRSEMGQQIRRQRTNGYSDLLLKGHFSAAETSFSKFKFNGRKYVESDCSYEVPDYENFQGIDQPPKWRFISCKEFYRDLNLH